MNPDPVECMNPGFGKVAPETRAGRKIAGRKLAA
jgi:hypothetical protein